MTGSGRVGGVLLAAGAGTRFGGGKMLAPLGGQPLAQWALDALMGSSLDELVLVLGDRADEVRRALHRRRARVVVAQDWAEGMAASLRRGVAALRAADHALIALADQPGLTAPAVDLLAGVARGHPGRAVRAVYDGVPGHPVVLPVNVFGDVAALTGDEGARRLLPQLDPVPVEVGHVARPEDVDTRDHLEAMRR